MRRLPYLFLGPTEKYFDKKSGSKVKKLVKALFDYEYFINPDLGTTVFDKFWVRVKPNTGYATAVAEAILEYREQNPNKPVFVELASEYSTDFEELPEKTQLLFKKLVGEDNFRVKAQVQVQDGIKSGGKAAYTNILNGTIGVVWYDSEAKNDSAFEKEYRNAKERIGYDIINLHDNAKGKTYSKDGVRKKATSLTYSYRINTTLPNGKKLTEEWSNFVTIRHAQEARTKRLVDAMWQEVEKNDITLTELFEEYIATKGDTPALQTKYKQYFNALVSDYDRKLKVQTLAHGSVSATISIRDNTTPYSVRGRLGSFSLRRALDGRYDTYNLYNEDGSYRIPSLSADYKQGFYAFLNNLFDYAYQRGYISYQPFMLIDISKV